MGNFNGREDFHGKQAVCHDGECITQVHEFLPSAQDSGGFVGSAPDATLVSAAAIKSSGGKASLVWDKFDNLVHSMWSKLSDSVHYEDTRPQARLTGFGRAFSYTNV